MLITGNCEVLSDPRSRSSNSVTMFKPTPESCSSGSSRMNSGVRFSASPVDESTFHSSCSSEGKRHLPIVDLEEMLDAIQSAQNNNTSFNDRKSANRKETEVFKSETVKCDQNCPLDLDKLSMDKNIIKEALSIAAQVNPDLESVTQVNSDLESLVQRKYEETVKTRCFGSVFGSVCDEKRNVTVASSKQSSNSVASMKLADALEKWMLYDSESRSENIKLQNSSQYAGINGETVIGPPSGESPIAPYSGNARLHCSFQSVEICGENTAISETVALKNTPLPVGMDTSSASPENSHHSPRPLEKPVLKGHTSVLKSNFSDQQSKKPVSPNLKLLTPPERSNSMLSESKSSVRNKLTQEIMQVHRAGDSSKIQGSLKTLKTNLKSANSPSSELVSSQSSSPAQPFVDRCSPKDVRLQQSNAACFPPKDDKIGSRSSPQSVIRRENIENRHVVSSKISITDTPIPSLLDLNVSPIFDKSTSKGHDDSSKCTNLSRKEQAFPASYNSVNCVPRKNTVKSAIDQSNVKKSEPSSRYNAYHKSKMYLSDPRSYTKCYGETRRCDVRIDNDDFSKRAKESTEFISPLSNIYPETNSASSRRDCGYEKFKVVPFKIPKLNKISAIGKSGSSIEVISKPDLPNTLQSTSVINDDKKKCNGHTQNCSSNESVLSENEKKIKKKKHTAPKISDDEETELIDAVHEAKILSDFAETKNLSVKNQTQNDKCTNKNEDVAKSHIAIQSKPKKRNLPKSNKTTALETVTKNARFSPQLKFTDTADQTENVSPSTSKLETSSANFLLKILQESPPVPQSTSPVRTKRKLSSSNEIKIKKKKEDVEKTKDNEGKLSYSISKIDDSPLAIDMLLTKTENELPSVSSEYHEIKPDVTDGKFSKNAHERTNVEDSAGPADDDEETLVRLKSIPSFKKKIEDLNLKGLKLYTHLLLTVNPDELKLVQEVLKGNAECSMNRTESTVIDGDTDDEKSSDVSSVATSCAASKSDEPATHTFGKNKNAFTKRSPSPSSSSKKSDVSAKGSPKTKKRQGRSKKTELDRLHADIKKMKHTKNNIFTALGPRSCRKQVPIYTDRFQRDSLLEKASRAAKVSNDDDYSTSSDDGNKASCLRSTRSVGKILRNPSSSSDRAETASSCDDGDFHLRIKLSRMGGAKNKRDRSSSSSSEKQIEKGVKKQPSSVRKCVNKSTCKSRKNDSKDAEKNLMFSSSKPKPCPKSVKLKRYGPDALLSDIPLAIDRTRITPLTIRLTRIDDIGIKEVLNRDRIEHSLKEVASLSTDENLDSSFSENNETSISYMIIEDSDTKSSQKSNGDQQTDDQDTSGNDNEQIIDGNFPLTQKIKLKKVVTSVKGQRKVKKLKSKLKNKKANKKNCLATKPRTKKVIPDSNMNERIGNLPECNSFKGGMSLIKIESIAIELRCGKLLYKCVSETCDYDSYDAKMFANHLSYLHKTVEWSGKCELCTELNPKSDIIEALAHLMKVHLTFVNFIPISLITETVPGKKPIGGVSVSASAKTTSAATIPGKQLVGGVSASTSAEITVLKEPVKTAFVSEPVKTAPISGLVTPSLLSDSLKTKPIPEPVKTTPISDSPKTSHIPKPIETAPFSESVKTVTILKSMKTTSLQEKIKSTSFTELTKSITTEQLVENLQCSSSMESLSKNQTVENVPTLASLETISVEESIKSTINLASLKIIQIQKALKKTKIIPEKHDSVGFLDSIKTDSVQNDGRTLVPIKKVSIKQQSGSVQTQTAVEPSLLKPIAENVSSKQHERSTPTPIPIKQSLQNEPVEIVEVVPIPMVKEKNLSSVEVVNVVNASSDIDLLQQESSMPPRIRVRRFSGDKLSGGSAISEPDSSYSRSSSVTSESADLEQEMNKGFLPVIKEVKTMPKQNDNIENEASDFTENSVDENEDISSNALSIPSSQRSAQNRVENHLMNLYKCGDVEKCFFSTESRLDFRNHCVMAHDMRKKRNKKAKLTCLKCVYCSIPNRTPEMLIEHIDIIHGHLNYQCPYCVYRACRPVYVMWHLQTYHFVEEKKILASSLEDNHNAVRQFKLADKPIEKVVPVFQCAHGCEYFTLSIAEFREHMKQNHDQLPMLGCHLCKQMCFNMDSLLKHYNFHSVAEFQCMYCDSPCGLSSIDGMKSHLTQQHSSFYPKAIRRTRLPEDISEGPIKSVDLDEPAENFRRYLKVVDRSVMMRLSNDDTSVSSAKFSQIPTNIVNLAPSSSTVNYSTSASGSNSESVGLSTGQSIGNKSISSIGRSKSHIDIGLSGKDLYRCGMNGCSVAVDDYSAFKEHTFTCDNARNTLLPTCVHCQRSFVKNMKFFEHIGLHGMPRYFCSLCDFKHTIMTKVQEHMKVHRVLKTKAVPADVKKNNKFSDTYIIMADVDKKTRGPQKVMTSPVRVTKPAEPTVTAPILQQVITVYSAEDVEKRLPSQLFKEPVKCGHCNYASKVRTNMLLHLESHISGLATNKDIVNPVPQMEKTELMFNKMTNHAAYSAKNDEKRNDVVTKIENLDKNEPSTKCPIPAFIPKTFRFCCGAPGCNYIAHDSNGLKKHFETLHAELDGFSCPHCRIKIPVSKIHFHFRYHNNKLFQCAYCQFVHFQSTCIEKHQSEKHPEKNVLIKKVRELNVDDVEKLDLEARLNTLRGGERKFVQVELWRCNLCRHPPLSLESLIKSHCSSCHGVTRKFKCSLCSFSADDEATVSSHLRTTHNQMSQVIVNVYKKVNEDENSISSTSFQLPNTSGSTDERSGEILNSKNIISHLTNQNDIQVEQTTVITNNDDADAGTDVTINTSDRFPAEEDRDNMFVSPYSATMYKCPFCSTFQTPSEIKMRDHIFCEQNYSKYVCTACGKTGISRQELEPHLKKEKTTHPRTNYDYFDTFTVDEALENRVRQALAYQTALMKQMSLSNEPISISSDDEDTENDALNVGAKTTTTSKTYSSTSNSNSDSVRKDSGSTIPSVPHCKTRIVVSPNRDSYQWPTHTASSKSNAKEPKLKSPPYKYDIATKVVATAKPSFFAECRICGDKFVSSPAYKKHMNECRSLVFSLNVTTGIDSCNICRNSKSGEQPLSESEMATHRRKEHDRFTCLRCHQPFCGDERLQHHVRASFALDSKNQPNNVCVPKSTNAVRMLCLYCPFAKDGNTFTTYLCVLNHIRQEHSERPSGADMKDMQIEVQVEGCERRPLTSCEIWHMQQEAKLKLSDDGGSNTAFVDGRATLPSVRRRHVAIKSTARPTGNQLPQLARKGTLVAPVTVATKTTTIIAPTNTVSRFPSPGVDFPVTENSTTSYEFITVTPSFELTQG